MHPIRRPLALAAVAAASLTLLVGCGRGDDDALQPAVNGNGGVVGTLTLRDVTVAYPLGEYPDGSWAVGDDAPVELVVANTSTTDADRLVSVSTPVTGEVTLTGPTEIPAGGTVQAVDGQSDELGGGADAPDTGELRITLTDLTTEVAPGPTYEMTFTFERAGAITLQVPLGAPEEPRASPTDPATPTATA